jgi:hypothetical protein
MQVAGPQFSRPIISAKIRKYLLNLIRRHNMKKLVVLLLASLVATSAFAVLDPDPDMMGIYFDTNADNNCLTSPSGVPFSAYLILTNTTAPAINAYELGLTVVVPLAWKLRSSVCPAPSPTARSPVWMSAPTGLWAAISSSVWPVPCRPSPP